MKIIETIRNYPKFNILIVLVFVVAAIVMAQYPNKNAWDRYIDSKKKDHKFEANEGPLDKKGEDVYYASVACASVAFVIGVLNIFIHRKKLMEKVSSFWGDRKNNSAALAGSGSRV